MKNKMKYLSLIALVMFSQGITAQGVNDFFAGTDSFLKSNVQNGRVDYAAIKNNPEKLNKLVAAAKKVSVQKTDVANYQAFWINTYNILVINSVVNNYPLKSPLNVPGFFDKITHDVGGENITLNDIENKLLRANFPEEARFHFVLVCAGLGCPPIIPNAYMPNTLDEQLQKQTVKALNDNNFIRLKKKKVQISQIFEWYTGDFTQNGTSLVDYINTYRTEKLPKDSKVSYYPYDWTLNESIK
ncbi:DUF547 domain-containing protein [Maribacter chungangensis]|uniref:DUF547 domain-containing protein n=1 Tax=Maribacter chungangensis TaxID=1069117 RepID=A0ABW3B6W2_9FLAO